MLCIASRKIDELRNKIQSIAIMENMIFSVCTVYVIQSRKVDEPKDKIQNRVIIEKIILCVYCECVAKSRKIDEPAGLLAGVTGLKLLGFVRIEGLVNGFPLKLFLAVELDSGVLELGFGLAEIGEGDLLPDTAITKSRERERESWV